MNGLRKSYDDFSYSLDLIMSSMFFIDLEIDRASTPPKDNKGPLVLRYDYAQSYCEKLGIDTTGPYGYTDCTDEAIRQALVRSKFYADNPSFESYYNWLFETTQNLKSTKELVFAFGRSQETEKYFAHAKKSGCGDVKGFETGLANINRYGGKPEEGYIYRASDFEVLQSTGNGILLKSMYRDAYKSQPIFVQTNRNYADGTSFWDSGPLVCFTGKMKQYSSVFGANRKVYSFKAIPVSKENYYFLTLGE